MDTTLQAYLENLHLGEFEKSLTDLGVHTTTDLGFIHVKDLTSIGMTVVQARRVLDLVSEDDRAHTPAPEAQEFVKVVSRVKRENSIWWKQQTARPRRLIFIRHGQSEANVDRTITATVPDHMLHLTAKGREQALDAGVRLKGLLCDESVRFTVSPYVRTQETLNGILHAWGPEQNMKVQKDIRIREQEYGNYDSPDIHVLHKEKKDFGAFYYRFPDGESPADCYDRASLFLESMYRSWADNEHQNHVIVGHGMMILVTLMRFLRIDVEDFENLESLKNCEFVVLERPKDDPKYTVSFTWAQGEDKQYGGTLRWKTSTKPQIEIWDGSPDAPLLSSKQDVKG